MTEDRAEILARLARIEDRLLEGDRRFEAMDAHVRDCADEKRRLARKLGWPLYLPFAGSILVALAILLD